MLVGLPRCHRLGAARGHGKQIQWGAFLRSVCIQIGDYAHAGCRVTNAFKKRLTETITTLTVGVVGVRRIASEFADIWSTLLQGCAAAKLLAALARKVCLAVAGKSPMIPKGYSGLVQQLLAVPSHWWNYGELWGIMGELWGIMEELGWNYGELWGIMGNYGEVV